MPLPNRLVLASQLFATIDPSEEAILIVQRVTAQLPESIDLIREVNLGDFQFVAYRCDGVLSLPERELEQFFGSVLPAFGMLISLSALVSGAYWEWLASDFKRLLEEPRTPPDFNLLIIDETNHFGVDLIEIFVKS